MASATANSGASLVSMLLYSPTQKEVIGKAESRPASSCRNLLNVSGSAAYVWRALKLSITTSAGRFFLRSSVMCANAPASPSSFSVRPRSS